MVFLDVYSEVYQQVMYSVPPVESLAGQSFYTSLQDLWFGSFRPLVLMCLISMVVAPLALACARVCETLSAHAFAPALQVLISAPVLQVLVFAPALSALAFAAALSVLVFGLALSPPAFLRYALWPFAPSLAPKHWRRHPALELRSRTV